MNNTLLKALDDLEEKAVTGTSIEAKDLIEAYFRPLLHHALNDTLKAAGNDPALCGPRRSAPHA